MPDNNEEPRLELLDEAGNVVAVGPLSNHVLQSEDQDGVKQLPVSLTLTADAKVTQWRSIDSDGKSNVGDVLQVPPKAVKALPIYLGRVDLKKGEVIELMFQTLSFKEPQD